MKNNVALVSIILPTYNRAEWIRRAIDSVLAQIHPHWELIIWDDGSTDDTEKLVKSYDNEQIRYFLDKNHGVAYARNRAIELACGEYLAFLDSDDEWSNEKLFSQVKVMSSYPQIDVLFTNFLNINVDTNKRWQTFEQYSMVMKLLHAKRMDNELVVILDGMPESLAIENFIATDSVMVRRKLLEKTGCFTEDLRNSEDFELWWRMGLAGVCFAYLDRVYLTRYKLPGNLSSSSILACENSIKGLDFCLQQTLSKGRGDIAPYLNTLYRNIWQNMISLYGEIGDRKAMLKAFVKSIKYGFNLGTIRLLVEMILNQRITIEPRK